MTIRERMLACYRRQPVDHPACAVYARYLPRGSAERAAREQGMGIIEYVPPVSMMSPPWHMLDGFLSPADGVNVRVEIRWENGRRMERRSFETPDGMLYADIERDAGGVGSEHIQRRYLMTEDDYRAMLYLARHLRFESNEPMLRERIRTLGEDGVVLGRLDRSPFQKCLIELANPETMLMDVMDASEPLLELMDVLSTRLLEAAEMAMDSACEVLWLPDNVTAEMTSPVLFHEFCLPYYQRLTAMAHQADKLLLAHFDGRLRPLREDILRAGFDGIESVSLPEMNGDMTLREAREVFPDIAVIPNFPANRSFDEKEAIIRWARQLAVSSADQSLLLQISEDLPAGQVEKVALALAEAFGTEDD